jgi:outer membrane protein assembly factor BamB
MAAHITSIRPKVPDIKPIKVKRLSSYLVILLSIAALFTCSCAKQTPQITTVVPPILSAPPPPPAEEAGDSAAMIYIAAGNTNDLYALDAKTGKLVWSKKLSSSYTTSAFYSSGRIIVEGYDNKLTAFDTAGIVQWTRQLPGNPQTPFVLPVTGRGSIVYAQVGDNVYSINAIDGSIKWTFAKGPDEGNATIVTNSDMVYFNSVANHSYALDATTGQLKWDSWDPVGFTPVAYDSLIYYPGGSGILVKDPHTGLLKSTFSQFIGTAINIKYGRIFDISGTVTDSATGTISYPSMQANATSSAPAGSIYPILSDSLAITPEGVANAFTGQLTCVPPTTGTDVGGYLSGGTYVNHVLYYTTSQRDVFNPYSGGHLYTDVYAYDVRAQKLIWQTSIENGDINFIEPCVVTKSQHVYRGASIFQ